MALDQGGKRELRRMYGGPLVKVPAHSFSV